jgi:hypothetical protein
MDARVDADVAAIEQTPGIKPTPEKRADTTHFEWLAKHHVGGWIYAKIAEQYPSGSPDVSAISRAVTETAALVGSLFDPRPAGS